MSVTPEKAADETVVDVSEVELPCICVQNDVGVVTMLLAWFAIERQEEDISERGIWHYDKINTIDIHDPQT